MIYIEMMIACNLGRGANQAKFFTREKPSVRRSVPIHYHSLIASWGLFDFDDGWGEICHYEMLRNKRSQTRG
jgi:hypothetical protein